MFNPLRLTIFVYVWPQPYLKPDAAADLDIEDWSDAFEWRQDAWNGLRDVATPVPETIETQRGDCEDYALVAASWALANDRDGVGLAFYGNGIAPNHVTAYDAERVYSSGFITEETPAEFVKRVDVVDWHLTRSV